MAGRSDNHTDRQKIIADMCKEIYKENMGHFRYFGTLRARIAYAPATIGLTVVTLFAAVHEEVLLAKIIFTAVLLLIFSMNYILQFHQRKCKNICKYSQSDWRRISSGELMDPVSSSHHAKLAQDDKTLLPDSASIILLFFLSLVAITAWVGLDEVVNMRSLLIR